MNRLCNEFQNQDLCNHSLSVIVFQNSGEKLILNFSFTFFLLSITIQIFINNYSDIPDIFISLFICNTGFFNFSFIIAKYEVLILQSRFYSFVSLLYYFSSAFSLPFILNCFLFTPFINFFFLLFPENQTTTITKSQVVTDYGKY